MTLAPLRAGVVGVGHLGKVHARIYSEIPGVKLVAVADLAEDRAKEFAAKFGCDATTDFKELVGRVDLVSIVVPTVAHCETALPFLQRGVGTLVEKPFAVTLEEADRMIAAAKQSGAILAVGHIERFNPAIRTIRDLKIEPRFIESHRLAPFSFRSTDVGVVLDLMIHDLDLILELVPSEIESIDAVGGSMITSHEDLVSARIRFRNGAVANLTASRVSLNPMRRMRVFSADGYVAMDFEKSYALMVKKGPLFEQKKKELQNSTAGSRVDPRMFFQDDMIQIKEMKLDAGEPLRIELDAFVGAVRSKTQPPVTGEHGRRALAAAHAVLKQLSQYEW